MQPNLLLLQSFQAAPAESDILRAGLGREVPRPAAVKFKSKLKHRLHSSRCRCALLVVEDVPESFTAGHPYDLLGQVRGW